MPTQARQREGEYGGHGDVDIKKREVYKTKKTDILWMLHELNSKTNIRLKQPCVTFLKTNVKRTPFTRETVNQKQSKLKGNLLFRKEKRKRNRALNFTELYSKLVLMWNTKLQQLHQQKQQQYNNSAVYIKSKTWKIALLFKTKNAD